jgi:sulfite exporter TauE/SafE
MIGFVIAAGMAGLAGSPHCVGMCGGFALACGGSGRDAIPWHLGRLTTYAVLGAVAGGAGAVLPGPGWVGAAVSSALIIWFAGALAGLLPEPKVYLPGLGRLAAGLAGRSGVGPRFAFGMANGLLPCGLVYAALGVPVAAGDPLVGAAALVAFGAGTVPALSALLLGAGHLSLDSMRARRLLALGVLVAGLWSVVMRQGLAGSGGHSHPSASEPAPAGDAIAPDAR